MVSGDSKSVVEPSVGKTAKAGDHPAADLADESASTKKPVKNVKHPVENPKKSIKDSSEEPATREVDSKPTPVVVTERKIIIQSNPFPNISAPHVCDNKAFDGSTDESKALQQLFHVIDDLKEVESRDAMPSYSPWKIITHSIQCAKGYLVCFFNCSLIEFSHLFQTEGPTYPKPDGDYSHVRKDGNLMMLKCIKTDNWLPVESEVGVMSVCQKEEWIKTADLKDNSITYDLSELDNQIQDSYVELRFLIAVQDVTNDPRYYYYY